MAPRLHLPLALCLALAAVSLYWPTLDHGFVFDDLWNIQQNEAHRLERLDLDSLARACRGAPGMGNRPVSNLSFALSFYLARPDAGPSAYRWANILIHACNAALVYGILVLTLGIGAARRSSLAGASSLAEASSFVPELEQPSVGVPFAATLLWLASPLQTESVTYLHQRMTSLAALFLLASLFSYILGRLAESPGRARAAFFASALCAALALGSKESAAVLPVVVVFYEWTFFQGLQTSWLGRSKKYLLLALLLLVVVSVLYLRGAWSWLEWMHAQMPYSPGERLLTQSRVVVIGLSLLLLPHPSRLNVDHELALSTSLFDPPTTLPAIGLLVMLVGLAIYCARRRWRFAFFGLLWLLGTQLIESSVIPVEMIAEHRLYLPSVGMLFLLLEAASIRRRRVSRWACVPVAGVALLFGAWTLERNQVWRDGTSLWTDAVAKSPLKVRPRNNLALALATTGETAKAEQQLRQVLRLQPLHPEARFNLGRLLLGEGEIDKAIYNLSVAVEQKESLFAAQHMLGLALLRTGELDDARSRLARALALKPESADTHFEMGNVLRLQGKLEQALPHYLFALERSPKQVRRHYEVADQLSTEGRVAEAIRLYEAILRVEPENAVVHSRLALDLVQLGRLEEARRHCDRALGLDPQLTSAQILRQWLAQNPQAAP